MKPEYRKGAEARKNFSDLGITPLHTSTTNSLYCLNRSSVVTRCSGSLIACAIRILSNGSLTSGGRPATSAASLADL